jgi:Rps23 Pro-64 3,4-dihydroxylase Tpa1-like proline 4-hydroxylase
MTKAAIQLHPHLDPEPFRAQFSRDGRVQIAPFLTDQAAQALREHLIGRDDWREVVNSGERPFEIDRAGQKAMTPSERAKLEQLVNAAARDGFQYRYETIRVPDTVSERRAQRDELLTQFAELMCSAPVLDLLRHVTGLSETSFVDAQATAYRSGDFLTSHDDAVGGKNRLAAYVLGLTSGWRAEWGGLLMFHDSAGDIERALTPRFNSLNIFAVPQLHSVSVVAPFAGQTRMSVTGWLRSATP